MSYASTNRANIEAAWNNFGSQLRQARLGPLCSQEGVTADDVRDAFRRGEEHARDIANKNSTKKSAYNSAHNSANELRGELRAIADDGKSKIGDIQNSKDPLPVKIDNIVDVVMECRTQANAKAATYGDNVLNAIQKVLAREGIDKSARQFAMDHGTDTNHMFGSPDADAVRNQVQAVLHPPKPEAILEQQGADLSNKISSSTGSFPHAAPSAFGSLGPQGDKLPQTGSATRSVPVGTSAQTLTGGVSAMQATNVPTTSSTPPVSSAGLPAVAASSKLLQSFGTGMHMGTPMSAGADAFSPAEMGPVGAPPPESAGPTAPDVASTVPSSSQTAVFDVPQSNTPLVDVTPAPAPPPAAVAGTTYVAGPARTVTPMAAASSPAHVGPLPAYRADIRPPVAAPSAPPVPTGLAQRAPSPAPANPSSGPLGQPAVARQPTTPRHSPAGVGEQAVVAAARGAVGGAASTELTARTRLQLLVNSVARREPRLRWAAGNRPDGSIVLVTDIAGGWVPPHVGIPTGMQLREPSHRRGDLDALLGDVTAAATYAPGQALPPVEDVEPVPTSPQARRGPVVEDLEWELGQATKWRDGLPRLAHTLAKAAAAGTGVLDNEIELLREHLAAVRGQVLHSYPDDVDDAAVGNWQLLAAIDALVEADNAAAIYHFAWFQVLSQAASGRRTR